MARLRIHVEGQTEETFVTQLLAPHLYECGYHDVSARLLGDARQRHNRGGIKSWPSAQKEIVRHLKADKGLISTTMVDYYALPSTGPGEWPGRADANFVALENKPRIVERALSQAFARHVDDQQVAGRFVPFVVMHEFEALLFSDCTSFARAIGRPDLRGQFTSILAQFDGPEHINDSPLTAPSKRVEALFPKYQKLINGINAAREVGLLAMRQCCPHFDAWLHQLERIPRLA